MRQGRLRQVIDYGIESTKVFLAKCIYVKSAANIKIIVAAAFAFMVFNAFRMANNSIVNGHPQVEFVKKIWGDAPHSAFTDLTYYKGYWYVVFREAESHHSKDGNGVIRVIRSQDTDNWETVKVISDERYDLRDSKFAITPKGRLMINYFCVPDTVKGAQSQLLESRIIISDDGVKWGVERNINLPNEVVWRIKWYKGFAYTITYQANGSVALYKSSNGVNFKQVTKLPLKGFPNEASIEFMPDGKMLAIIREEQKPNRTYLGESYPPYTSWKFTETPKFAGGPNLIKLPDNNLLASFRQYENGVGKLWLAKVEDKKLTEVIDIKSSGDCGYAGMIWKDDALWISYYSTHEQKANIYLAKVKFHPLKK